jgi:3-hydroxyisobutyrate dehydrogenase
MSDLLRGRVDLCCCLQMVFGNCGVLAEMSTSKGYVEMTGVDSETSQDVADAINSKGGRYLEAQIQGSKSEAEEGSLIILAAGDRSLYEDCQSSFQAMGKHSFFLGKR